jgi:MFS family permease
LSHPLLRYLNHFNLWFDDAQLTNYVLFFWLPYFLGKTFDPVTSNLIAALYSVGMMPGGIIVGYVSDFFGGRRAVVIGVFMATLIVFLGFFAMYSDAGMSPIMLLVMLGCMGILVGGYVFFFIGPLVAFFLAHFVAFCIDRTTLSRRQLRRIWLPTPPSRAITSRSER